LSYRIVNKKLRKYHPILNTIKNQMPLLRAYVFLDKTVISRLTSTSRALILACVDVSHLTLKLWVWNRIQKKIKIYENCYLSLHLINNLHSHVVGLVPLENPLKQSSKMGAIPKKVQKQ